MKALDDDGRRAFFEGQTALIITPFLPVPENAGQRKRVYQFTDLLKKAGCTVTMLHYAVEQPHNWSDHRGSHHATSEFVDELITIYPGVNYGKAPLYGRFHGLDEWWDTLLGDSLQRLFVQRWFDIVVVNNVWLSRCLDYAPPGTTKVLDTHDVFSHRYEAYKSIGVPPDFFSCSLNDEAFGWNRAEVVVAITESEREIIAPHLHRSVSVHLPYTEGKESVNRSDYLHSEKVTFGFMGSAHPFNVSGLRALIEELSLLARWSPIELIIAGEVSTALNQDEIRIIKNIGYVKTVEEFYEKIDICVSPLDFGSGLKIKVVEAVSKGIPIIATKHSSIGAQLDRKLIVENVSELARKMAEIADRRPPLKSLYDAIDRSQENLYRVLDDSTVDLFRSIVAKQHFVLFCYPELLLDHSDAKFWSAIGLIRELSYRGPVVVDLGGGDSEPSWLKYLPPRVMILGDDAIDRKSQSRQRVSVSRIRDAKTEFIVFTSDGGYCLRGASTKIYDARFTNDTPSFEPDYILLAQKTLRISDGATGPHVPFWSSSILWDPIFPTTASRNEENLVFLVVRDNGGKSLNSLVSYLESECGSSLKTFKIKSMGLDEGLAKEIRECLPKAVVEFSGLDAPAFIEQLCAVLRISFKRTASVAELRAACRGLQAVRSVNIEQNWQGSLSFLVPNDW